MGKVTNIPRKPTGRVVKPGGVIVSAVRSKPPQKPRAVLVALGASLALIGCELNYQPACTTDCTQGNLSESVGIGGGGPV